MKRPFRIIIHFIACQVRYTFKQQGTVFRLRYFIKRTVDMIRYLYSDKAFAFAFTPVLLNPFFTGLIENVEISRRLKALLRDK